MKFKLNKVEKKIQWVHSVYTPRVNAIKPETILSMIEPYGGCPHPRFRPFWYFADPVQREFWKEYLEAELGILIYVDATGLMRLFYGADLVRPLVCGVGKNNPLVKRLNDLIKKDKRRGRRR